MAFAVAGALLGSGAAQAQVSKAEWQQFKAQFEAMSQRVQALEEENQKLRAATQKAVKVEDLNATNAQVVNLMAEEGTISRDSVSDIRLPEGVREALGRRLDRLSEDDKAAVKAVIKIGARRSSAPRRMSSFPGASPSSTSK